MYVQHPTHPTAVPPCQGDWVRHVHQRRAGAAAAHQPPYTSSDLFSQTRCWLVPHEACFLSTDMKCEGQRRFLSRLQQPVQWRMWQCGTLVYRTGANEQCASSLGDLRDDKPRRLLLSGISWQPSSIWHSRWGFIWRFPCLLVVGGAAAPICRSK